MFGALYRKARTLPRMRRINLLPADAPGLPARLRKKCNCTRTRLYESIIDSAFLPPLPLLLPLSLSLSLSLSLLSLTRLPVETRASNESDETEG